MKMEFAAAAEKWKKHATELSRKGKVYNKNEAQGNNNNSNLHGNAEKSNSNSNNNE